MNARARALIDSLGLVPHPEGGFREVYRSLSRVQPLDTRPERSALTTIYFLLTTDEVSRWHRVASDEVWHHYEGEALELLTADDTFERVTRTILGSVNHGMARVHVVTANSWQAARSLGAYSLMGCTVAPGFEFDDFRMLRDRPEAAAAVRARPDIAGFV
jgi:predicted cupin superfamily sugar epimerase